MSTLTVTNTFVNGAANDGPQVTQNFSDVTSYINSNCIVKDGTVALTALLSGPALDPTSANHLARKQYVDDRVGRQVGYTQNQTHTITALNTWENVITTTITNPSKAIGIKGEGFMSVVPGNADDYFQARVGISFDNGATYTYGDVASSWIKTGQFDFYSFMHYRTGTPTGNIKIIVDMFQATAFSTSGNTPRTTLFYDMFKIITV